MKEKHNKRNDSNDAERRVNEAIDGYYAAFQKLLDAVVECDEKRNALCILGEMNIIVTTAMHKVHERMLEAIDETKGGAK